METILEELHVNINNSAELEESSFLEWFNLKISFV